MSDNEMDVRVAFKNIEFHFIDGKVTVQRFLPEADGTKKRIDGTALTKVETQLLRGFLNNCEEAKTRAETWKK